MKKEKEDNLIAQSNQVKKNANAEDINQVLDFTKKHYAKANPEYFGKADPP